MGSGEAPRISIPAIEPLENRLLCRINWGAIPALIDQDQAYRHYRKLDGRGQTVAVIDTGVDYRHPALGGRLGNVVIGGYDFVQEDDDPMDETGHGTQVAGIIAARSFKYDGRTHQGIAPKAKIVALRVADNTDFLPDSRIERALRWVISNRRRYNITTVNISIGDAGFTQKTTRQPYGDELQRLRELGVVITAASGNSGVQKPAAIDYPAADRNVIAVGAVNAGDVISRFTSRNAALDLLAPGEDVPSTFYDIFHKSHTYNAGDGTSYASPYVAGAAVLLRQISRKFDSVEIGDILKVSGVKNRDGDRESPATHLTFRRLDLDDAISLAYDIRNGSAQILSVKPGKNGRERHRLVRVEDGEVVRRSRILSVDPPVASPAPSPFNSGRRISELLGADEGGVCD